MHARREPVTTRSATVEDAATVARIYVESWNRALAGFMPDRVLNAEERSRWATDLGDRAFHWRVAVTSTRLVGFVGVRPSRGPQVERLGELDTIAVHPEHWRTGIGTVLMHDALTQLREMGFHTAVLWTLAGYEQGTAFYERCGWLPSGETRDHDRQVAFRHDLTGTQ